MKQARPVHEPFPPLLFTDLAALAAIVAVALLRLAPGLAHPAIFNWDESLHQAVARGTYEDFFYPHIYSEPLHTVEWHNFWASSVYLIKPPGPFWAAALIMKVIGVTPLALRLVSLFAQLAGALAMYFWLRGTAGKLWAAIAGIALNCLPLTWQLTQGTFFGDATDCGLLGCLAVSFVLLMLAVERQAVGWFAIAGAATGAAILFKAPLGLPLLGVVAMLAALRLVRFCEGPRLHHALAFAAAAAAVALPWNLYAAHRWPDGYAFLIDIWLGHISKRAELAAVIGPWSRPIDGIFNEVHQAELQPLPVIIPVIGGVYLLIRAVARREPIVVGLALWCWASWIVLSYSDAKVPAVLWGGLPAVLSGIALLGSRVPRSPVLTCATLAGLATPLLVGLGSPKLAALRQALPLKLDQSRRVPGLVEGGVLVAAALLLGIGVALLLRRRERWRFAFGALPAIGLAFTLVVSTARAQGDIREQKKPLFPVSYTREVGLALSAALEPRAVIDFAAESDPPCCFETQNLMFWTGRMVYRGLDLPLARSRGFHPYLVSGRAEPFAPLDGVPLDAWMRAYDLERPLEAEAALPPGLEPIEQSAGPTRVHGFAAGKIDGEHDRWAFFVSSPTPAPITFTFHTSSGNVSSRVAPEATLRSRPELAGRAWFILPVVGPPRASVSGIECRAD